MAIKDDIDSIKEELNTQEQFLENIIKSERFFKKYKKIIIGAVVLGIVGAAGYYINGAKCRICKTDTQSKRRAGKSRAKAKRRLALRALRV